MSGGRLGKLVAVAIVAMALVAVPTAPSEARPSGTDLAKTRARLEALNSRLSVVDEQYNRAVIDLAQTERRLELLSRVAGRASQSWQQATRAMSAVSVDAYTHGGDQILMILGAQDPMELVERLEFLSNVTAHSADVAQRAGALRRRAAAERGSLVALQRAERKAVSRLGAMRAQLERGAAEAQSLIRQIQAAASQTAPPRRSLVASRSYWRPVGAPGAGAKKALQAAYSAIGTPYRYGGSSPQTGFDCSGLAMWAWAHGGVSLPHSASDQYASIPHVSRGQLQPGDLVFFYSPIHHVGIYIGNGQMIDASHPGETVDVRGVTWNSYSGAGRPGV